MTQLKVYEAIAAITLALSKEGIAKGRKNSQQNYSFRGIDDIYNALAPELAKNKLCVLPRVLERSCEERATKSGGTLFYVNVRVAFDCVSAEDGSKHEIVTMGEAMDSGDKATNKAMSAAYKYAALMAFCIPTEGDNDTENLTHEVVTKPKTTEKTLEQRLASFSDHLDKLQSSNSVTNLVAANNGLMFEAKKHLPEKYEELSIKINQIQESFALAN